MLERLRQNMRDMNRTVKWVMKKTSQVNERDQGRGRLWRSDGMSERLMVKLRPLGFRVRLENGWTEGKGSLSFENALEQKSLARDGTVRSLVGQVHSELERWWEEIRMERTGWRCDFEIYSRYRGKLPKALVGMWCDCSYIKKIIIMIWPLAGEKFKG